MTVQRQYTLPNCSLMVEGLSGGNDIDPMAPLTVVLNTEFTFPGITDTLSGGREFLDALAKTVSSYAQSILSGIAYPMAEDMTDSPVLLKPGENERHQLIANVTDSTGGSIRKTLTLSTVQIFDLMEAVDQLLADTQTLPDMTLQLSPLHRRHALPAEPIAKRAVPPAIGISALAASAALLFVVPVPDVERRLEEQAEQNPSSLVEEETSTTTTATGEPPSTDSADSTESPASSAIDEDEEAPVADAGAAGVALNRLSDAPEITDPDAIAQLEAQVEDTLGGALPETIPFEESLVYRIAVSESGDLLGFKYENDAALDNIDNTPLPDLTFVPVDVDEAIEEPVAQFRVTFE
ncbi:MAG: DUF4335 domain-containing protein, partial [Cyanobacteria bacterium P01_D01_bin.115]